MTDVKALGATKDKTGEYLTFQVGSARYGVEILRVKEIRGWTGAQSLPELPEYMKGVINLRGTIVPLIDLRIRFHAATVEYLATTVVIIISLNDSAQGMLGLIVDSVSDVVSATSEGLHTVPPMGEHVDVRFLTGVITIEEEMVLLLNLQRLLSEREMAMISSVTEES